ncbi:MAG: DUF1499 domain-containing protein [Chloroflexota bacterium]
MRILLIILVVLVIFVLIIVIGGRAYVNNFPRPSSVGTGTIAPCPESPNCVSSKETDDLHKIDPFDIGADGAQSTLAQLEQVLSEMDNSTIITKTDNYLFAEFRSPFWRFVDDVEFFAGPDKIDVRSAARIGYSDMNVNRKRVESIRKKLASFTE